MFYPLELLKLEAYLQFFLSKPAFVGPFLPLLFLQVVAYVSLLLQTERIVVILSKF